MIRLEIYSSLVSYLHSRLELLRLLVCLKMPISIWMNEAEIKSNWEKRFVLSIFIAF